ncbi:MAG: phosphopyruvate hydratase [Betaproteobacteria bacterium AqS2]|uniref:Enolase n=1 Tax=Candidatus Amphirhobacter heronislandensis TaxID=1732024 RepID=A0A930UBC3_9GAMM|nr:phosphopyruvate hydratase [Betaproteobacteria bacterium AqS2]
MFITNVTALEVLDSRGNPTVEATVHLADGSVGRACAPSGASTGSKEALELRDGDPKRFGGKGVRKACAAVTGRLRKAVMDLDAEDQEQIDARLLAADGTANKAKLGANAILAVSLAAAKAAAESQDQPLYRHLGGRRARLLPVPMLNILNGGAHASNNVDVQEFMVLPAGAPDFATALRWGAEIFAALKSLLAKRGMPTSVGDEGGFAPDVDGVAATLDLILEAIAKAGRKPGKDVWIALDCAANEFYAKGTYNLRAENKRCKSAEFAKMLAGWASKYPIASIEDGMAEGDWAGWKALTKACGDSTQLVGDDLFVTDTKLLGKGIKEGVANAILVKPNQCGSLTETEAAVTLAQDSGYATVMSHRSGETEDTTIADLAVAWSCGQIKTGAPSRGERTAKFNRLLRIEQELGRAARFAGRSALRGL